MIRKEFVVSVNSLGLLWEFVVADGSVVLVWFEDYVTILGQDGRVAGPASREE
jgi:hypothetical protein